MKKEYILCAAIHYDDGVYHEDEPTTTGLVISGRRHSDCYRTLRLLKGHRETDKVGRGQQGFLTSTNRYVDRAEGYVIAKANNQLLLSYHDDENPILISEDLY